MKTHEKFLSFNGKNIYFTTKEGENWIAIKPICEALEVDYIRQFKNLKENKYISQLLSEQTMVAGDKKLRKMICLPEKYIYGWIFSLNSESPELWKYKLTCYELLYNHFNGILTGRRELLQDKRTTRTELAELKEKLKDNEKYNRIVELEKRDKAINKQLKNLDVDLIEQPKLF